MLDMTKFPPLSTDFLDYTISIDGNESGITNNSVCSIGFSATKAARGLSLVSQEKKNVQQRTTLR